MDRSGRYHLPIPDIWIGERWWVCNQMRICGLYHGYRYHLPPLFCNNWYLPSLPPICWNNIAFYWITEAMPIPATSLIPIVMFPVLGIMPATHVSMLYLNNTYVLLLLVWSPPPSHLLPHTMIIYYEKWPLIVNTTIVAQSTVYLFWWVRSWLHWQWNGGTCTERSRWRLLGWWGQSTLTALPHPVKMFFSNPPSSLLLYTNNILIYFFNSFIFFSITAYMESTASHGWVHVNHSISIDVDQ